MVTREGLSDRVVSARRYGRALAVAAEEAVRAGRDRWAPAGGPIPLDARSLTPADLAALTGTDPARVRDVDVLASHRGSADRACVGVQTAPGTDLAPTLFLKLTPSTLGVRLWSSLGRLAEKEVHFYLDAAPSVPGLVPRCYGAAFDPRSGRSIIALEDLAARGATFPTVATGCTADQAHAVALALGTVHRAFWRSPRFDGDLSWFKTRRNPWTVMEGQLVRTLLHHQPGRYNAAIPDDVRRASQVLVERPGVVRQYLRGLPRTLIHNDSHPGNMYLDGPAAGILDWQEVSYGPPVHDIGYFMAIGLAPEVRRAHERDVLGTYLDALGPADDVPGWDTAWTAYRAVAATAFTSSVYTASFGHRLQAEDVVVSSIEHTVAAVRDLETFELLAGAPA
jgi:hypothetical protein